MLEAGVDRDVAPGECSMPVSVAATTRSAVTVRPSVDDDGVPGGVVVAVGAEHVGQGVVDEVGEFVLAYYLELE